MSRGGSLHDASTEAPRIMHTNSKLIFEKYATQYFPQGTRVLEIGPDGFPSAYRSMVDRGGLGWDTLDVYQHPSLTHVAASEYSFPIADDAYDVVLSGQVIEHVRKIWVWMREVARVCKPGGTVITINPVSWPYHEAPIDCWRAYPEGMKALYEDSALEVLVSHWESLEEPRYRKYIPGASREARSRTLGIATRLLGRFGFPVERAYDTITIGRKR
jgi:SAM-dependent methyltransferase